MAVVGTDIGEEAADQHNHLIDATHTVPSLRLEVKPCGEPGTMHNHRLTDTEHKLGQGDSVNFHENEERTGSTRPSLVTNRLGGSSVPELCPPGSCQISFLQFSKDKEPTNFFLLGNFFWIRARYVHFSANLVIL